MFIELEVGWMSHPFPTGSFKISSNKQIDSIRALGLTRIRHLPDRSDPAALVPAGLDPPTLAQSGRYLGAESLADNAHSKEQVMRKQRAQLIGLQRASLAACERSHGEAVRDYKNVLEKIETQPKAAADQCLGTVNGLVDQMVLEGESAIRLLSEGMGDQASMHSVNVTVMSLLLGKAMGLVQTDMVDLGMAAFLHDVGKSKLPQQVRWFEEGFALPEYRLYQDHVSHGVAIAKMMGLTEGALLAIAQHHEMADGSGFPLRLRGDSLSPAARILALVNRYENLCNPVRCSSAMTPHEALALIFAQQKNRFDGVSLRAFIRMMGVYPPGSVVQLVDERVAMVVSVNSSRPLKPRLIVFDSAIPKDEALILDLEQSPMLGIRRSLKPSSLPKAVIDYLSPRQRVCYFFERAIDSIQEEARA